MTNYERAKNRSISEIASTMDELAKFLCKTCVSCPKCPFYFISRHHHCNKLGFINWLESEVEE